MFVFLLTNTTKFELGAMKLHIRMSAAIEPVPGQLRECNLRSLSTGESFVWKVRTRIMAVGPVACTLSLELSEECQDEDSTLLQSEQYSVPVADFLLPDESHLHLGGKFRSMWRRLPFASVAQCSLAGALTSVREALQRWFSEVQLTDTRSFQLGYMGTHLLGERVAVLLSGLEGSSIVRFEVRCASQPAAFLFCSAIDTFIPQATARLLVLT